MEAHPPTRELKDGQRVCGIHIPVIEQHIAQATTHNNANHGAQHNGAQRIEIETHLPTLSHRIHDGDNAQETRHISKSVPTSRKGADGKSYRIKAPVKVVQHVSLSLP